MKARHSLLPIAVMALGSTGCFETQTSETFEDTVVHDDTQIRVLHASPDAPRLDMLLDGEQKLEDLDYGQTRVLTPPADWYDLTVEGRTAPDRTQTMLTADFDRFDEDRHYDLLVAGSVDDDGNTLRTVLLSRDEAEQEDSDDGDDESLSMRAVNLAESEDELDVVINGDDDEPVTTLGYAEGSDTLELDEAVTRIRLQKPESGESLFDSGKRVPFSAGDELLVAVVPNTSATAAEEEEGGSPVKVLILNEDRVTTVRNEDEPSSLRFVHAAADSDEVGLDVDRDGESLFSGVVYEDVRPNDGLAGIRLIAAESADIKVTEEDTGDSETRNISFSRGHGRTVLALNDAEGDLDVKSTSNDDRRVATNARVRVFNASRHLGHDGPGPIDVYLLDEGDSLAEDEGVLESPVFGGLNFRKMSRYEPVAGDTYELIVTRADEPEELLLYENEDEGETVTVTFENGGLYDLVVAGDGNDDQEERFQLIQIGGAPDS